MRRARFTVAYDGTSYNGFAEQVGVPTVMGELRAAIERITQRQIDMFGAGRTDAGVHGWGQVVSLDLPEGTDLAGLQRRINRLCSPGLAARDIEWVADPEFHARFSAVYRHYRYHVLNSKEPNPFVARTAWHITERLHLPNMVLACDPLIGEHDFATFCRRPKQADDEPPKSLVRRVIRADWKVVEGDTPGLLRFEIRANAFCHQMVRSIVGTLVDVGLGKLHAGDMRSILIQRNRQFAGQVAPPHGLVLWEVGYPVAGPTAQPVVVAGPSRAAGA